jgi:hypothetical protein
LKPIDAEARFADERVDLPVEVATPGNRAPDRVEPVLPARDAGLGRAAVLHEQERPAGPERAPRLSKSSTQKSVALRVVAWFTVTDSP